MSKIQETAVAIRYCLRIQKLADERAAYLRSLDEKSQDVDRAMLGLLADNAQQVCSDAGFLIHTYEQELTAYVPESLADLLTQMLVVSEYFHSHELTSGNDAETVVRLLLGRLLEGLISLAGRDSSPLFEGYFNANHTWPDRVAGVDKPLTVQVAGEPSAADACFPDTPVVSQAAPPPHGRAANSFQK